MGSSQKLREALAGGPARDKERKEPAVADGILSVTPDPPEAAEWRNKSVLDTVAADSSFHQEDAAGKRPTQLFGKFTWRIENFSSIKGSKRELRSAQFDVGEYKWYVLVYPQGCDVCNHLSLFLCVADYDKLLPGWSHFAQFTIAVVNKDPKKSKYSDTLHRFCKKEHDWGWKKFMELSKVLDGFTVADTLVIKAQVQVILDRPSRPFRCLDAQYRRELVRVYLTNVESICRRFCEDRRQRLSWLREEGSSFSAWWRSLSAEWRKQLTTEKGEAILKGVVKQFFNEKEVTSTLVMDALYCGCRQLEFLSRKKGCLPEGSAPPCVVINGKALTFSFALDALEVIAQLSQDFLPPLPNDKVLPVGADGLGLRSGCDEMSELRRDALERDEKRLAELGRRTVEMYAVAHVFTERLERAYRDHQAEKRMKDLIAEEEEAGRLEDERAAARAAADKEKRAKKKERKKAKKEADKAKRDAEEAERARQEAEKRAEIERRVAEANERRRQEELEAAAQQQKQQDKKQQQQEARAAAQRKQQPLANGDCSTAHEGPSANGIASSSEAHTSEQGKQQQQQVASARSSSDAADGPSASSSAPAVGGSGRGAPAAGSRHQYSSSSSSPAAPASVADDASEVTSTSDLDDSSSLEMGSSSSKGFTPVLGRHHTHHQQQQQQQPGTSSARGSSQPSGRPLQQQQAAPSSSQPQQQQPGSIPTGYAAAVAGMRTPPAAEVVSAAAALAEQARRYKQLEEQHRELEQQVSGYKQQVEGLEDTVASRDAALSKLGATVARQAQELSQQAAVLSQKAAAIAQKDAALSQKDQQLAQLREQVAAQQQQVSAQQQQLVAQQQQLTELRAVHAKAANELRAAQAVSSRGSSKDGGGVGRKVSGSSEDGAGSGRGRGLSGDLASAADALASSSSVVDGYSPSAAPWAAIAAGTASAAGAVGSSLRDSGTASSSGSQDLAAAAAAAAGAPANGLGSGLHVSGGGDGAAAGAAAGSGPLSYAESVGGQALPQHMAPPGLQSHPSGASIGTPRAGAGAGPGPGSSGSSSAATGTGRGSPAAAGDRLAGNRPRQPQGAAGKEPAAGAAADDSGIGRSRFVSSAPQQRQQQQHGGGMPVSRTADGARGAALGKGVQQAAAGSGSYLSNGIAGVLHSSVPPSTGSPSSSHAPLHSYRNAAAATGSGSGAAGMGPSSIAAMGGAGAGPAATAAAGMLGGAAGVKGSGVGGGSLGGAASKVPGSLAAQQQQQQQQQHPFAYASNLAGGGGFGSMAAGPAAKGPNAASPAGGAGAAQNPTSTASSLALDDAGMDGFVHMHMIDELLTE